MKIIEQILTFLDPKMTTPEVGGWFHLLSCGIVILIIALLFIFAKGNKKLAKKIVLIFSIVCILLEIYKQLEFSFDASTGVWSYSWYAFPFQFCSTPMYIGLLAGLTKKEKFQDILYSYLATFSLFAGIIVMIIPVTVFTSSIGINIQTMFCHGGMVVVGAYLYISGAVKPNIKTLLKGLGIFVTLMSVALILNVLYYHFGDMSQVFNMFFISPYFDCSLLLLETIYQSVPYIIFLLIYTFGFTLAAFVCMSVAMILRHITISLQLKNTKAQIVEKKDD